MTDRRERAEDAERLEAMGDLRAYMRIVEERGELEVVDGADPHLEMGALYELSLLKRHPPVLLFENIKGYSPDFRVLTNVRFARTLVGDLDLERVRAHKRENRWASDPIPPKAVNTGPVMDNVITGEDVDINIFPAPQWKEGDGGRYIGTECLVINKDPDSGWVNVGTYRSMIHDGKTLAVFIEPGKHGDLIRKKYWARGEACPMVICVGQAPVLGNVAGTPSRHGLSEFDTAGGHIGRPIEIVHAPLTGLPIPADAEIAFEGVMPPVEQESAPEGPFGEWPGYYASAVRTETVLRVKAVYHRDKAVVIGQPPALPTYPGRQPSIRTMAALWDALEAAGVPGITGVWKPLGGGVSFINVISVSQLHAGHAKMAGLVAAGCGPGAYMTRIVIVVDDDIDITDEAEVMWALATRWDPKTQTDFIDDCWTGYIDPHLPPEKRAADNLTTTRVIIYAVRPYHWKDDFPKVNAVDKDYAEEVREKWAGQLPFLDRPRR
ncbi:MAG: UbiD family decarboxylase [Alphaproteobacteria bacterium]|nr:UbiD family decarboxylase [Alphaproteobacteria bacterium]